MARQEAAAFAVLLAMFVVAVAAVPTPATSELSTLAKIKAGLDPSGTVLASWTPTKPCTAWLGLVCDQYGHVLSMTFNRSAHFNGSLVGAVGGLPYLTSVTFQGSGLIKAIPLNLVTLPKMLSITVAGVHLQSIPNYFGNGTGLTSLNLSNNAIAAPLPGGINLLTNLTLLDLSNNFFKGPIYDVVDVPFRVLHLYNNSFSGPLPNVGFYGSLQYDPNPGEALDFQFQFNQFSGEIPYFYVQGSLDVSHNQLTGPLPLVVNPDILYGGLDFSHNALSGTLDDDTFNFIGQPPTDISYNQFSGPLPNLFAFAGCCIYPALVESNYFTGAPVWIDNTPEVSGGDDIVTCVLGPEYYIYQGGPPPTSLNCFSSFSVNGTSCPVTPQRSPAQCAAFCGNTSPEGPCGGNGACSLNGSTPVCTCNAGYKVATVNGNSTCVPA